MQTIVRVAPAADMADADSHRFTEALAEQHQREAAKHLDQRQHCRARRIVVKAQRLVDSQLNRGGLRAAAQRQHGGEAGEAEHKNQRSDGGNVAAHPRPFDEAEEGIAAHAKLGGNLPLFTRDTLQRLQQQAGGHRHIEKDVRQQDAQQTVGREIPLPAERVKQRGQPALAAIDAEDAEHRHQHRQDQGHRAQAQQQCAAREATTVKGAGEKDGRHHREQR